MQRIRLFGLTLLAILALGALASSSAFAEEPGNPTILPTPTAEKPTTFTAESTGETVLETALSAVICAKAKGSGSFTSQRLGTVKIDFEGCKLGKTPCTGSGEAKEVILVDGKVHLVDVLPTGTLDLGVWIEPTATVTFTCGIVTVKVKGSVIGVADNINKELLKDLEKGKEFIVLWKGSKGVQEVTKCDLTKEFCEGKEYKLTADIGFGEEKAAQIGDAKIIFTKEVEFHF